MLRWRCGGAPTDASSILLVWQPLSIHVIFYNIIHLVTPQLLINIPAIFETKTGPGNKEWHLVFTTAECIAAKWWEDLRKVKPGACVSVSLAGFPRWPCGESCVIRDLINRWICCIVFPGRELLPWQPHHKRCKLMVGNYDLPVETRTNEACGINFELCLVPGGAFSGHQKRPWTTLSWPFVKFTNAFILWSSFTLKHELSLHWIWNSRAVDLSQRDR